MNIKCDTCHRVWTGLNQCHCTGCHRHFSGPTAFDKHLRGTSNRACVDPATLVREDGNPLLVMEDRKLGEIWTIWDASRHGQDVPQLCGDELADSSEDYEEEAA